MTGRVQTLRSNVAGNRPTGRAPGELYVNWPDKQLGVVDSTATAVDLLAVRFFSTTTSYNQGDYVVQGGKLYTAKAAVPPGAFTANQWSLTGGNVNVGDTPPATPDVGTMWFDSAGGQLYVWYNDGNTTQWVIATNAAKTDLSALVPLAGGTMTGPLILAADPTQALGAATKQYADAAAVSHQNRNRLVNGSMRIDQWNGHASASLVNGTFFCDRWRGGISQAGKLLGYSAVVGGAGPTNAAYCLQAQVATPYTPLAGEIFTVSQPIEQINVMDLAWGTPFAAPITLSFLARATVAGTYSGSLNSNGGTRSYPFTFSLPSAGAPWTPISITIPGDTSASWPSPTPTSVGMWVQFDLGNGANSRAPAGAWVSGNYSGANGAASLVTQPVNSLISLTNVQLEMGSVATPFDWKNARDELDDCLRYYWNPPGTYLAEGYTNVAASNIHTQFFLPIPMRALPTIAFSGQGYSNSSGLVATGANDAFMFRTSLTITAVGLGYCNFTFTANAEL
jgi:hypothetical protein